MRLPGDGGDVVRGEKVLGMKGVECSGWKEVSDTRHKAFRRLALGTQTARDTAAGRKLSREVEALLRGGEHAPASTPTPTPTPKPTPQRVRLRPRLRTPTTSPHLKLLRSHPRIRRISLLPPSTRPNPRIRRISILPPSSTFPPAPHHKTPAPSRLIRKIPSTPTLADPTLVAMLSFHVERVVRRVEALEGEVVASRGGVPQKVLRETPTTFPSSDNPATPPVNPEPPTRDAMTELEKAVDVRDGRRSRVRRVGVRVDSIITKQYGHERTTRSRAVRKVPLGTMLPRRVRFRVRVRAEERRTEQREGAARTKGLGEIGVRKVEVGAVGDEEREARVQAARRKMEERRAESETKAARGALQDVVRGWIG